MSYFYLAKYRHRLPNGISMHEGLIVNVFYCSFTKALPPKYLHPGLPNEFLHHRQ